MQGEVCPTNLSPAGRRQRTLIGGAGFVTTFVVFGYLVATTQPRAYRLLLAIPIALTAAGYFQVKAGVCIAHAARGTRETTEAGRRVAPVADANERGWLAATGRTLALQVTAATLILTAVALALPA